MTLKQAPFELGKSNQATHSFLGLNKNFNELKSDEKAPFHMS